MKTIPLTQGKVAIVDNEDFKYLNNRKWYLSIHRGNYYYAARGVNKKILLMHRVILKSPSNLVIDHINGDGLDNRKSNLRICTQMNNLWNQKARRGGSKFKGVCWHHGAAKWFSRINVNGHRYYLGLFNNEVEAALAYDRAALQYHGEFANLNFP